MLQKFRKLPIVVADEHGHVRRLVVEILRTEGFNNVHLARDGEDLLTKVVEFAPRVVFTTSALPKMSGLEFTRTVRAGYRGVNRALSIIVMTNAATPSFLNDMRKAGADEVVLTPFSATALMARLESVLLRPRRFIESANYKGPCRRRKMIDEYGGPLRRFVDPVNEAKSEPWEAESNRALARLCVQKISEMSIDLKPGDRQKLRQVYAAAQDTEQLADDIQDQQLGDSARSLSRYIVAIGANGVVDPDVVSTHIDAMQKLGAMGSAHSAERQKLVEGLGAVVDKRLGVQNNNSEFSQAS
jgi:two-component system, chemotaxis family, chemotaxis protein CheY